MFTPGGPITKNTDDDENPRPLRDTGGEGSAPAGNWTLCLSPFGVENYCSGGEVSRQRDGPVRARLHFNPVYACALHGPAAVNFEMKASCAEAEVSRNRGPAWVKIWSQDNPAALEPDSQPMMNHKECDFTRCPGYEAGSHFLRTDRGNFLEPSARSSALHGVQPLEASPAAVVQPCLMLRSQDEAGGQGPGWSGWELVL